MASSSRRGFIGNTIKTGIGTLVALPVIGSLFSFTTKSQEILIPDEIKTGFDQQPLPYAFNALEPYIAAETMNIHYSRHAAAYSKNLKEAAKAEGIDVSAPLENVLYKISRYSAKVRNNGGGHYNHELFWKILGANTNTQPTGKLLTAIEKDFGSLENLKKQFNEAAKARFGSGWAWLIITSDHKLVVTSTANQDNNLMDIAEVKGFPLFGIDVWEHAYYLKYRNLRAEYVDSFWKVLNWEYVQERFNAIG
ncbi:MAG: superoxide dismutase [Sphingobacteriales bacterium]|nr:superoxide dismutase [Sphingobacteriales bacterium]